MASASRRRSSLASFGRQAGEQIDLAELELVDQRTSAGPLAGLQGRGLIVQFDLPAHHALECDLKLAEVAGAFVFAPRYFTAGLFTEVQGAAQVFNGARLPAKPHLIRDSTS